LSWLMGDSATFWTALSKIFGDGKQRGRLWEQGPAARKVADQLFDSGTSIGANAEETEGAQTP